MHRNISDGRKIDFFGTFLLNTGYLRTIEIASLVRLCRRAVIGTPFQSPHTTCKERRVNVILRSTILRFFWSQPFTYEINTLYSWTIRIMCYAKV